MEPTIAGFAVIAGTRIILPVEVSSIDGSVVLPAIATIGTIQFANISVGTVEVGTVSVVVETDYIGTLGSIQSLPPVAASISGGILQDVGTIGTIVSGAVSATITGGNIPFVGTVGTLQAGNVSASITGGQLANVGTVGTIFSPLAIGTILSGVVSATILGGGIPDVGTVGTLLSGITDTMTPTNAVTATVSATISGASGTLYGIVMTSMSQLSGPNSPGTLLVFGLATIPMQVVSPSVDTRVFSFDKGMRFTGSLVASLIGTLNVTFMV